MSRPKKEMPPSKGRKVTIRITEVMQAVIALYKIRDLVKDMAGEYRGSH